MTEYHCFTCDNEFELSKYCSPQLCPDCLQWDAVPIDELEDQDQERIFT